MPDELCTGHSKRTKKPCGNHPMRGSNVCRMHGGATKQARAKAKERRAEEQAQKALARMDVQPIADPLTALAELAGQAVAFKDAIAEKVNKLRAIRFLDHKGSEQLRSELAVFERALDRCERFVTSMVKLGLDERLVRIEEKQADLVLDAIEAALDAADVPADMRPEAKRAAVRILRAA